MLISHKYKNYAFLFYKEKVVFLFTIRKRHLKMKNTKIQELQIGKSMILRFYFIMMLFFIALFFFTLWIS